MRLRSVGGGARTRRRRMLVAGALAPLAALLLAACGGSGGSGSSGGSASGAGGAAGGTHTVRTAMGDVKVQDAPERVVVLDTAELDSALTLGVKPVGATRAAVASGFLDYLPKDEVAGIEDVGEIGNPDLEAVAALRPDLILTSKIRDGARYRQLSAIAPTVMTENTGYPWKANFQVHAAALGRKPQAARAVTAYEKRVGQVRDALGGASEAAAVSVNVVRFVEGADIRVYGRKNYLGTILADVGLGRPAVVDKAADGFAYDVSPERIDLADADAVFTSTYGDPEKSGAKRTMAGPLWRGMAAYRAKRVFPVDDELWLQGIGYTAAGKILTELRRDLTR
ncbi:ABC transporter substrate-binding protein [Streptomyces sp. NPDC050560]|uniref:ABC transporter substrate-binding protein n=1 Tax=Streptomyces sp. NPDC050560 TaxID=3365630 RepID=UPI0037982687